MGIAAQLDVKVVYSASSRGGRRRKRVHATPTRSSRLLLLGLINLIAAGSLCYGVWWWQDSYLRVKLLLYTQMPGADPDAVSRFFDEKAPAGTAAQGVVRRIPPTSGGSVPWKRALKAGFFPATVIGWEILATAAACALALSGGTLVSRGGSGTWRRGGIWLALLGLAGAGYALYALWGRYGRVNPIVIRTTVTGFVVVTALIGLIWRNRERGLAYLAAILLILSAAGTAGGLHVAARYHAVPPEQATPQFLAIAFGVHSVWGWVLLMAASRIAR